jgi:uncharacterized protein YdaU (DUF1376 family)
MSKSPPKRFEPSGSSRGLGSREAHLLPAVRSDGENMPAKWQQWMPFKIDAFRGSPSVQAMHPCSRAGYLYLLAAAWQSEDCTISADPVELADASGLGDALWAEYGGRILRKFSSAGNMRLKNIVLQQEWLEAKRVFEARKTGAQRTNSERSADGHRADSERQAYTRTTVVDVSVNVPVAVGKDDIEPEMVAMTLADNLRLAVGYGRGSLREAITEVALVESRAGRAMKDLAVEMEAAYRFFEQEKPTLRIQWNPKSFFGDGHWRNPEGWPRKAKSHADETEDSWKAFHERIHADDQN